MGQIKEKIEKIKEKGSGVKEEVREKTLGYILAALGLVAGLSWNETIKAFIEYFFPLNENSLFAKLVYSIFITFVVVFLSMYMTKLFRKGSGESSENQY